jgi:hypothetical protein
VAIFGQLNRYLRGDDMHEATRTEQVLEILTHKVRLLSCEQLARLSFGHTKDPHNNARSYLARLQQRGLVRTSVVMAHPLLEISKPLLDWHPTDTATPQFARLAWHAKRRYAQGPVRMRIAVATDKARSLTGGVLGARPIRAMELDHDLAVANIYQRHFGVDPERRANWVHEDQLVQEAVRGRQHPGEVPDAILRANDTIQSVIEVLGRSYSPTKIKAIYERYRHHPLELW